MTISNTTCAFCEKPIYRKPSLIAKSKSNFFFCSKEHQALASRKENGLLKIGPERKENSRYNSAKCLTCAKIRRSALLVKGICKTCAYISQWLNGEETGTTNLGEISVIVRHYIVNLKGAQCWECGWNKTNATTGKIPVQIDHIDGNSSNNSFSNLRLLCPNCHSLTSTYGNNGGRAGQSARVRRYKASIK